MLVSKMNQENENPRKESFDPNTSPACPRIIVKIKKGQVEIIHKEPIEQPSFPESSVSIKPVKPKKSDGVFSNVLISQNVASANEPVYGGICDLVKTRKRRCQSKTDNNNSPGCSFGIDPPVMMLSSKKRKAINDVQTDASPKKQKTEHLINQKLKSEVKPEGHQVPYNVEEELLLYQVAASKIRSLGKVLYLSDKVIHLATIYMHIFHRYQSNFVYCMLDSVAAATLLLAGKVDNDKSLKLEALVKGAHICSHPESPRIDVNSQAYLSKLHEVRAYENYLLISIGFSALFTSTPQQHLEKLCKMVNANDGLKKEAFLVAEMSLALTSMITSQTPEELACASFHLACKWTKYKINPGSDGKEWFYYIDKNMTYKQLSDISGKLLGFIERAPKDTINRMRNEHFPGVSATPEMVAKNQKWKLIPIDLPKRDLDYRRKWIKHLSSKLVNPVN